MEYKVQGTDVLIVSILVLFLGTWLTRRFRFLRTYNIPEAVTGGIVCSTVVALIYAGWNIQIVFDTRARDVLLLIFFSTIGLSAKFRLLAAGGRALALMVVIASVFLVIQDVTGVLVSMLFGASPAYGLFAGSVSLAGGYGTAVAWGDILVEKGLRGAQELGVAFATFGLIAGGMIGGPIAGYLIRKHGLEGPAPAAPGKDDPAAGMARGPLAVNEFLGAVLVIALCVEAGDLVNRFLFSRGVTLPGFLTSMAVGIVITNAADRLGRPVSQFAVDRVSDVSLPLFLSMSLMTMQLWTIFRALGPIFIGLAVQVVLMTFFAVFVVFRLMGRDYDASVIASGFVGLGLGATPVGIANMNAITGRYGPSPKSFLVIPLVGAFFIDIVNAMVIKFFLGLPMMNLAM